MKRCARKLTLKLSANMLRMDNSSLPRVALTWAPDGKRKRGRPRETWRRTEEKLERMAMGYCS